MLGDLNLSCLSDKDLSLNFRELGSHLSRSGLRGRNALVEVGFSYSFGVHLMMNLLCVFIVSISGFTL